MDIITDGLLLVASVSAIFYCLILSRRLKRFTALETGMGGAIAVLSVQVDDMTRALDAARKTATSSELRLKDLTENAANLAKKLELITASFHDVSNEDVLDGSHAIEKKERPRFVRRRDLAEYSKAAE